MINQRSKCKNLKILHYDNHVYRNGIKDKKVWLYKVLKRIGRIVVRLKTIK